MTTRCATGNIIFSSEREADASSATTVVIPTYNRQRLVTRTLDSVSQQTRQPRRVIVVDDASTDETASSIVDWYKKTRARWPLTVIRHTRNEGVSVARNTGWEWALSDKPRYVAFLDSDDLWPASFLARMEHALDQDEAAVAATSSIRLHNHAEKRSRLIRPRELGVDPVRWFFLHDGGGILSASVFRSQRLASDPFDASLRTGGDIEFLFRLAHLGPWIHVDDQVIEYEVQHKTGDDGNLSRQFNDCFLRWAEIWERFLSEHPTEARLGERLCSEVLAEKWLLAARYHPLDAQGRSIQRCIDRALSWHARILTPWRER